MNTTVERYKRRSWALKDSHGNLIAVTLYKRGARNLQDILSGKTIKENDEIAPHQIAEEMEK